jgi:hypothetical protein
MWMAVCCAVGRLSRGYSSTNQRLPVFTVTAVRFLLRLSQRHTFL